MIVTDMGDIALHSQLEIYIGDKEKTVEKPSYMVEGGSCLANRCLYASRVYLFIYLF